MSTFEGKAAARMRDDLIAWMTTVAPDGTPQTSPVWFLWRDEQALVYSLADTPRIRNIAANPRVSLHLDGDGFGGDIVVLEGDAEIRPDHPPADQVPEYVEKYQERFDTYDWDPGWFAGEYPVPIVVTPTRARAW